MIALVRVDSRLVHGQVIEAWLPHLGVHRILVADDETARSPLASMAYRLAVPPSVQVEILPITGLDFTLFEHAAEPIFLIVRDLNAVRQARLQGLGATPLNLGNMHFSPGRAQVTPSLFMSQVDASVLEELARGGMPVEARAIPREPPLGLSEILCRARH
ncbi:MAG: PTS sugar transporter subunit IIB [Myxococcales bacterium]|jgi:PTS system mannose-specific IIB component|nr:PTS sugar transporter subunit IIB [Myxococcales bacterium]